MKISSFLLLISMCVTVNAQEVLIAITPHQAVDILKSQVKQSLEFATGLEPGDRVHFLDAYHVKPLGTFEVPSGSAYASVKARLKANKKAVASLMRFAVEASSSPETVNGGAIDFPGLLRYTAHNHAASNGAIY